VSFTERNIPGGWSQVEMDIGPHRFCLFTPRDPDAVLGQLQSPEAATHAHCADPYWAKLWPAAKYLAEAVVREGFAPGTSALELGCGSGLVGLAALASGLDVTFSDYVPLTVELALENAARNGFAAARGLHVDWRSPPAASFPLILAADVTYDRANVDPLLDVLDRMLARGGVAWIADGGRSPAEDFFCRAIDRGWSVALFDEQHRPASSPVIGRCQRLVLSRAEADGNRDPGAASRCI
jgi:predicted nicotinamide N-methyase